LRTPDISHGNLAGREYKAHAAHRLRRNFHWFIVLAGIAERHSLLLLAWAGQAGIDRNALFHDERDQQISQKASQPEAKEQPDGQERQAYEYQ
jgi:hypothetical protein